MSLEPTAERTRDVLKGLEPHQNLKHLQITGYSGATSPTWLDSNVSITSLQKLHLENCREWRILGSLEMLPLLMKLTFVRMWNLTEFSIPSLEELVFVKMPKLKKCIGTDGLEWTSRLRVLMVKDCPKLNEFTLSQSDSSFQAKQKSWFLSHQTQHRALSSYNQVGNPSTGRNASTQGFGVNGHAWRQSFVISFSGEVGFDLKCP